LGTDFAYNHPRLTIGSRMRSEEEIQHRGKRGAAG